MEKALAYYVSQLRKDFSQYCEQELRQHQLTDGLFYFVIYLDKLGQIARGGSLVQK